MTGLVISTILKICILLIPVLLIGINIWLKIQDISLKKSMEAAKEILDEIEGIKLNQDIEKDRINFYPNKKEFLKKGKGRLVLFISVFFSLLFVISFPLGLTDYLKYQVLNWGTRFGTICFAFSIVGYLYYAARFYDKSESLELGNLYYDNNEKILFFDTDIVCYPAYMRNLRRHPRRDWFSSILQSLVFGQYNVAKVIYSIKNISNIKVSKDNIVLFGDVIMTSFDERIDNSPCIEPAELNKNIVRVIGGKRVNLYSKKMTKIKIPRAYGGFEKFLISKQYPGTEWLV